MPTLARVGPYRFFFYSNEGDEPAHIHVRRDRAVAKSSGLKRYRWTVHADSRHMNCVVLQAIVDDRRGEFLESWNEYFG